MNVSISLILLTADPGTESSAANWLPPMLVSLGIVIILVLWTMSMRGRIARRSAQRLSPREQIEQAKTPNRSRNIENALSAEFVSTATEIADRLENKAERLEQLIERADQRIARLNALTNDTPSDGSSAHAAQPVPEASPPEPTQPPSPEPSDPLTRQVFELAEAGRSPVEIAQELDEQVGKVELILALRR